MNKLINIFNRGIVIIEIKVVVKRIFEAVFCYPYGDYNKQTLKSLLKSEVKLGFTTVMGKSSIKPSKQYSELLLKNGYKSDWANRKVENF